MAHDGEVFGRIVGSEPRLVFAERDVERPMKFILDLPVAAHGLHCLLSSERLPRYDEVPVAVSVFAADGALGLVEDDLGESLPSIRFRGFVGDWEYRTGSLLLSAAFGLGGRSAAPSTGRARTCLQLFERLDHSRMEFGLVVPNGEQVAPALVDNLRRDARLASGRVDGHETAFDAKEVQQTWQCLDLVRPLGGRNLPETDSIRSAPRTHHGDERTAAGLVEGSPQDLAVDRHHVLLGGLGKPLHPASEELLQRVRVELGEEPADSVVRWDPGRQVNEPFDELLARVPEALNRHRVVDTANYPAKTEEQDRLETVTARPLDSRVGQLREQLDKRLDIRSRTHRCWRLPSSLRHARQKITPAPSSANHLVADPCCLTSDAISLAWQ